MRVEMVQLQAVVSYAPPTLFVTQRRPIVCLLAALSKGSNPGTSKFLADAVTVA